MSRLYSIIEANCMASSSAEVLIIAGETDERTIAASRIISEKPHCIKIVLLLKYDAFDDSNVRSIFPDALFYEIPVTSDPISFIKSLQQYRDTLLDKRLIDEIDRSVHTRLSQYLLSDFIKRAANGSNQIIFTAHDVNLIDLHLFRQDEIWFIDKNQAGESKLRPFSDFSVQDGMDTIKAYLSGRFGAVPMIRGE